jgi:hypothetical protein
MKVVIQVSEAGKIPLSYVVIKNMASMSDVESVIAVFTRGVTFPYF